MKHIVIYNGHWCSGGAESMITNLLDAMNKEDLKFTILATQKETDLFDDVLKRNNVNFLTVLDKPISNPVLRTMKNSRRMKRILSSLKPDVFHINCSNASGLKYARLAKKLKVPKVIVHSHNAKIEKDLLGLKTRMHKYWKRKYSKYPDVYIACSDLAFEFMYSNKYNSQKFILKNGVDTYKLKFNKTIRSEIREKYNITEDMILLGHIGRYVEQKNHKFLIEILKELKKRSTNFKLMLLGEGYLKTDVFAYAEEQGVLSDIIDIGVQKDVYRFYQAFDYFLLPSLHEGLPVVGIEAQAAGLPCGFADTIDAGVKLLNTTELIPIKEVGDWVEFVLRQRSVREDTSKKIEDAGFDIHKSAKALEEIYKR
ncbi:MAG: glycosyltransferase [Roseburia sp.]|nr:glycosyltransferase [Anaeroplasma bactoclasticum]MCM1196715.1 glycosyltransferase [Roseburia sp.]MCM1557679.1 glycosyltransferase [Anaeroplasma bactoclasticum]